MFSEIQVFSFISLDVAFCFKTRKINTFTMLSFVNYDAKTTYLTRVVDDISPPDEEIK